MVKVREAQSVKDSRLVEKIENRFVEGVEQNSLITLSLDDLAMRFVDIGRQAHLLQGQILLEARNRFPSDKEFGQWCTLSLCEGSMQHRNRLMNLARYFKDREILGISLTVAYEISAPANQDIADTLYEYTKGKNLKVIEVKEKIAELKMQAGKVGTGTTLVPDKNKKEQQPVLAEEVNVYQDNDKLVTINYGSEDNIRIFQVESFYLYALRKIGVNDISEWLLDVVDVYDKQPQDDGNIAETAKKFRHATVRALLDLESKIFSFDNVICEYVNFLKILQINLSNEEIKDIFDGIRGATDRFEAEFLPRDLE